MSGYNIRELRNKKGWTQEKLAEKSGVSRALIAGLESGATTETSTVSLKKLAIALNCEVGDIFFNTKV